MNLALELSEKAWDAMLFGSKRGLATTLGWTTYHVLHSQGSRPGFPDRLAWRERVIFAELKTETGKLSAAQVDVLTALAKAGAEVYAWRPSDLSEIGAILSRRWQFGPLGLAGGDNLRRWIPSSLWLPSGERADAGRATA